MSAALSEDQVTSWNDIVANYQLALESRFKDQSLPPTPHLHRTGLFRDPFLHERKKRKPAPRVADRPLRSLGEIHDVADYFCRLATGEYTPSKPEHDVEENHRHKRDSVAAAASAPKDLVYGLAWLEQPDSHIRLVNLLPGRDADPIIVQLFSAGPPSAVKYEALSYVWGDRDHDESITVEGMPMSISGNLASALRSLRPSIREGSAPRVFWIDALCINQSDMAEKSAQVAFMGTIYREAAAVTIYMGQEQDDSAMIMEYLGIDDEPPLQEPLNAVGSITEDHDDEHFAVIRRVKLRAERCGLDKTKLAAAVKAFFKRPWWSRMWVVQEFALASTPPRLYCGRLCVPTDNLFPVLRDLAQYLLDEATATKSLAQIMSNADATPGSEVLNMAQRQHSVTLLLAGQKTHWTDRPLSSLLIRLLHRQSTDPRDQIFAVREMLDPVTRMLFKPDYSLPVNNLFLRASGHIFLHPQWVEDTLFQFHLMREPGCPSWCLDFGRASSSYALRYYTPYSNTMRPLKYTPSFPIHNRNLRCRGVTVDTIDRIFSMCPPEPWTEDLEQFIPRRVVLPFPCAFGKHLKNTSSGEFAMLSPVTPAIHGHLFVNLEAKRTFSPLTPGHEPVALCCASWQDPPTWTESSVQEEAEFRLKLVSVICKTDAGGFFGGAYFDLSNLKSQIQQAGSSADTRETCGRGTIDSEPQYEHITSILSGIASKEKRESLKAELCSFADRCASMLNRFASGSDPLQEMMSPEYTANSLVSRYKLDSLHEFIDGCTCTGQDRSEHLAFLRHRLADIRQDAEETDAFVDARWKQLYQEEPVVSLSQSAYVVEKMRQISGIFTTRRGFLGITFQRQPGLALGDEVVLLDGISVPVILGLRDGESDDGERREMKCVSHVVGIEDVDVEGLLSKGLCVSKEFSIT